MSTAQAIMLLGLIALPIGLMAAGYIFKRIGLLFSAVGAWILFAVYCYGISSALWDVYYGLFWLGIAMAIVSAVESMSIRGGGEETEEVSAIDRQIKRMKEHDEKMGKYRDMLEGPSSRSRRKRREGSSESARLVD